MQYSLDMRMLTVIESPLFTKHWPDYWNEPEHDAFVTYIATNPDAGDVIPGTGGCRKVRWMRPGAGKRGGVRVIYVTNFGNGNVALLLIYGKSAVENIPAKILREIAKEFENARG